MKFLTDFRLLLLAIWLGAALFFIAVAQSAFAVLPEREMAGAVVNRTLSILNLTGLAISAVLLVTSLATARGTKRYWVWTERALLLVIAAACAIGQFVIGLWLGMVRVQMGRPIDQVPADDPLRVQFNNLHEWSVWVLMAAMGAALIAFFVIANRKFGAVAAKADPAAPYDFSKEFKI
jgi:hypothetical protein